MYIEPPCSYVVFHTCTVLVVSIMFMPCNKYCAAAHKLDLEVVETGQLLVLVMAEDECHRSLLVVEAL